MGLIQNEQLYFGVVGSLFCRFGLLDLLRPGSAGLIALKNCGTHGTLVGLFSLSNSGIVSLLQVHLGRKLALDWHPYLRVAYMDYRELQEIQRVLWMHEETIQCNRNSIFLVTSKVHENKHQCTYQIASIMHTLVQQKQQITTLDVECNMLRNMVVNLSKGN